MEESHLDNIAKIFATNIRINQVDAMSKDAVWPNNIEICICRVPIRKRDGYNIEAINSFAAKLKAHMVPNGIVFFVCYAPVENKGRPFEVSEVMIANGFNHIDNIIIQKSWFPGKRSETNLVNTHEYVMHFCNGNVWKLDRLPIREYLGTPENVTCPGNTWVVETGSLDDSYSIDLAELLVRMTDCLPGSVIFDPFMGSQAGLQAALKLGHSFHGFEKDKRKIKKYEKLITKYKSKEKENKRIFNIEE